MQILPNRGRRGNLLYDGQGSTRQLASYAAANDIISITDSYNYDAYGVMLGGNPAQSSTPATNLLYAGEQWDTDSQHYYNRARWYNPMNGLFNRMDPYAGNTQDPQSLHKYLYCHNNPVNGIDPTGLFDFSLTGMMQRMVIHSALMNVIMPVVAPLINKVTSWFIPDWFKSMILLELPTAVMGGSAISTTVGYGIGGGVTGLVEGLWFPGARKLAAYYATGITTGVMMSGGGAGITGSLYGGLVYGAQSPDEYTERFYSVTFAFRSLPNKLQEKIENALTNFISELTLVSPNAPNAAEQLAEVRQGARAAAQAIRLKNDAIISVFTNPSGKVGGVSIGASGTLGKGLDLSFSWPYYTKFWEWSY